MYIWRTEGQTSCLIALRYALNTRNAGLRAAFVPRCRADGTYAPVQCAPSAGCWCVNPDGKTYPDAAVRNGRPDCTRTGKTLNLKITFSISNLRECCRNLVHR